MGTARTKFPFFKYNSSKFLPRRLLEKEITRKGNEKKKKKMKRKKI
jgi:hypothetical protein